MTLRESIAARLQLPERTDENTVLWEFCFEADDPVFAGHFPGHPVLPAIVQLEMARQGAEWALGCPLAVREFSKSKFQRPILPGEVVRVELKWTEAAGTIRVRAAFSVVGQRAGETTITLWRSE